MKTVAVVVTYLELDVGARLALPGPLPAAPAGELQLERIAPPAVADVAATMYRAVGGPWHWTDRLPWTGEEWRRAVDQDAVELWVACVAGDTAGYFELHVADDAVELKYIGLLPEFTGRRIGGTLLSAAIDRARCLGRPRMTVNTCTLDHPAALPNYLKRGFTVVKTEAQRRTVAV